VSVSVLPAKVRSVKSAPEKLLLRHITDIILLEYGILAGLCLDIEAAQLVKVAISFAGAKGDRMTFKIVATGQ
jgi:hypothetical protein